MHRKQLLIAACLAHFALICLVCWRDTCSVVAKGYTVLPSSIARYARSAEPKFAAAMCEKLSAHNPLRQVVTLYAYATGIDAGYGFFAPNVPENYKLVFEIHYPDGHVDYELPRVASDAAGLRLSTLLDNVGGTPYDELREVLVKMMAYSIWQEHPNASFIRAVLGLVLLPDPAEFRRGMTESYQFMYAYDLRFPRQTPFQTQP
jgi:hypothetical protein